MTLGTQSQPGNQPGKEGKQALSGSINVRDTFTRFYSMAPERRAQIMDQLDPQTTSALKTFLPEPLATFIDEMGKSSGADVNRQIGDGAQAPRPEDVDQMVERVLKGQGAAQSQQLSPQQQLQAQATQQITQQPAEVAPAQGSVAPRPGATNGQTSDPGLDIMRQLGLG